MNHIEHLIKSLFIMASMVEARDPYTGGHLWRVSQYSRTLAEYGGLPANIVARIALGGFLHDLGKISVPDAILNKAGKLTDEEYAVIKTHTEVGSRLLSDHPLADLARFAVIQHHETPDGLGYPEGLTNEQISVDGRIVGICDAFDAMTSTRPYRKGMPVENALTIIQVNLGKQFHQEWGEKFIKLGEAGFLNHIVGHSETGIPLQQCPICGPTIVVSKHHQHGDHVFCRACGSEALVKKVESNLAIEATGRHGAPSDLEPEVDNDLLDHLAQESSKYVSINAIHSKSFWHWPF
jgi:DNA-directed RNA polymerase subunit RPC12/RpoP